MAYREYGFFFVTREAIRQWFSLVTSSLIKIIAESPHSRQKISNHDKSYIILLSLLLKQTIKLWGVAEQFHALRVIWVVILFHRYHTKYDPQQKEIIEALHHFKAYDN